MMTSENSHLTASLEDYLEAIYTVIQEKQAALPKDIRKILKVGRSSVSGALKVLGEKKLINHESYGIITLTHEGIRAAEKIALRHDVLKNFFVKILAVEEAEADKTACLMEHAISSTVLEKLTNFVEFVEACPRGGEDWLKQFEKFCETDGRTGDCDKCISLIENKKKEKEMPSTLRNETANTQTLKTIAPGQKATIEKIRGGGATRQRLMDMGVTQGAVVKVEKVAPLGDPMEVTVRGYHLTLRKEEADSIIVSPISE